MKYEFRWIRWNVDHIGIHGVLPDEAEYVVRHPARGFPRNIGDDKVLVEGQSLAGRYLRHPRPAPERTGKAKSQKTEQAMSKKHKPYDQMTTAELAEATKEYDEPFAALRASKPLTPAMKAAHRRAAKRGRGRPQIGNGSAKVYISMERDLLKNADRFAKKNGMSRSELIARGVRAVIGSAA